MNYSQSETKYLKSIKDTSRYKIYSSYPDESSDRGGGNPLDWFCEIFAKNFFTNKPMIDK